MFSINNFSDLNHLFVVAQVSTSASVNYLCLRGGDCQETFEIISGFKQATNTLLTYFFDNIDPDNIYKDIFDLCKIIAGLGALRFLMPLMLDSMKQNYSSNMNKIFLLFMLMLMFTNQGVLGKSIAYGNYAFIQGIHEKIQESFDNSQMLKEITEKFALDQQMAVKINNQVSICSAIPETKQNADGQKIPNPAFQNCYAALKEMIKPQGGVNTFRNASTDSAFRKAIDDNKDFVKAAAAIKIAALGFINVADTDSSNKDLYGIRNLLVGWRAAIAIVPDLALIGALLFYPFPLAISFINVSFLQSWFTGMWSVGLFKFTMTIFNSTFIVIQEALAGEMPQDTLDLVLGIAAPTIAIALATGSGLGLSSLVSQGVSNVSSRLAGTSSNISDANRNANPVKPR